MGGVQVGRRCDPARRWTMAITVVAAADTDATRALGADMTSRIDRCRRCAHFVRPGMSDVYCTGRDNLPEVYGEMRSRPAVWVRAANVLVGMLNGPRRSDFSLICTEIVRDRQAPRSLRLRHTSAARRRRRQRPVRRSERPRMMAPDRRRPATQHPNRRGSGCCGARPADVKPKLAKAPKRRTQ